MPRKSKSSRKKESNNRFANASLWAKETLAEPGMKKLYSKGINSKLSNAQIVAVTDFLTAPVIHYISLKQYTGAIGDKVRIKATDNFQVISVEVKIRNKNGKELEKGPAIQYKRKPVMWIYSLTAANADVIGTIVEATAKDRPGNTTVKSETVEGTL